MGVEGKPQTGRITYKEFKVQGIYQVPRTPSDNLGFLAYKAFRTDPVANPLKTPSGKLQIHWDALGQVDQGVRVDGSHSNCNLPPTLAGLRGNLCQLGYKDKRTISTAVLGIGHYMRRSHSVYDNVTWLRQAFPQELWINPIDAEGAVVLRPVIGSE